MHEARAARELDGTAARELARVHHATMPHILNKLAHDERITASSRIAAIKETRDTAAISDQTHASAEKAFVIDISFPGVRPGSSVGRENHPLLDAGDRDESAPDPEKPADT